MERWGDIMTPSTGSHQFPLVTIIPKQSKFCEKNYAHNCYSTTRKKKCTQFVNKDKFAKQREKETRNAVCYSSGSVNVVIFLSSIDGFRFSPYFFFQVVMFSIQISTECHCSKKDKPFRSLFPWNFLSRDSILKCRAQKFSI